MSFGIYAGMYPKKGQLELTGSQMSVGATTRAENLNNNNIRNPAPGLRTPIERNISRDIETTLYRSTMKQVLPCKAQADSVQYGRHERSKTNYMYPSQGYARKQEMGLATDHNKPMNTKIMPLAGFYNPNMLNVLGNVK